MRGSDVLRRYHVVGDFSEHSRSRSRLGQPRMTLMNSSKWLIFDTCPPCCLAICAQIWIRRGGKSVIMLHDFLNIQISNMCCTVMLMFLDKQKAMYIGDIILWKAVMEILFTAEISDSFLSIPQQMHSFL